MSIKSLRAASAFIGVGRPIKTPIELDPTQYRGGMLFGDDDQYYFSDGVKWVLLATGEVSNQDLRAPRIISPESGDTTGDVTPTIKGTEFAPLYSVDTKLVTRRFQVRDASDQDWDTPVVDIYQRDTEHKLVDNLDFETQYEARIKDYVLDAESEWSDPVSFTTTNNIETPQNLTPTDGEEQVPASTPLVASAFTPLVNQSEQHVASQWQITNLDTQVVTDTGEISARTGYSDSSIFDTQGVEYSWRARYKGDISGWSAWSEPTTFFEPAAIVEKPENISPPDGNDDTDIDSVEFTSSAMATRFESDTHVASEWRVLFEGEEVYNSGRLTDSLTSFSVPQSAFSYGRATYEWQVRHEGDALGWSEWSDTTTVIPFEPFVIQPTALSPSNDALVLFDAVTLQATSYDVAGDVDAHVDSQWRVIRVSTSQTIYDSGENDTVETSHAVPSSALDVGENYAWQVRYKGATLGWSAWSDQATFETAVPTVVKPTNIAPGDNAGVIADEVELEASEFDYQFISASSHLTSQWQVFNSANALVWDSGSVGGDQRVSIVPRNDFYVDGETYSFAVRYEGQDIGFSEYSDKTSFVVTVPEILTPSAVGPFDGETGVTPAGVELEGSTLQTSAGSDTIASAEFEVVRADTQEQVFSATSDSNTVRWPLPDPETAFLWRVRYTGENYGTSDWSDLSAFTTGAPVSLLVTPEYGPDTLDNSKQIVQFDLQLNPVGSGFISSPPLADLPDLDDPDFESWLWSNPSRYYPQLFHFGDQVYGAIEVSARAGFGSTSNDQNFLYVAPLDPATLDLDRSQGKYLLSGETHNFARPENMLVGTNFMVLFGQDPNDNTLWIKKYSLPDLSLLEEYNHQDIDLASFLVVDYSSPIVGNYVYPVLRTQAGNRLAQVNIADLSVPPVFNTWLSDPRTVVPFDGQMYGVNNDGDLVTFDGDDFSALPSFRSFSGSEVGLSEFAPDRIMIVGGEMILFKSAPNYYTPGYAAKYDLGTDNLELLTDSFWHKPTNSLLEGALTVPNGMYKGSMTVETPGGMIISKAKSYIDKNGDGSLKPDYNLKLIDPADFTTIILSDFDVDIGSPILLANM